MAEDTKVGLEGLKEVMENAAQAPAALAADAPAVTPADTETAEVIVSETKIYELAHHYATGKR